MVFPEANVINLISTLKFILSTVIPWKCPLVHFSLDFLSPQNFMGVMDMFYVQHHLQKLVTFVINIKMTVAVCNPPSPPPKKKKKKKRKK